MIIGPSACGKSTAIRESGLSFPVDPDSKDPSAIKGLGGTRNCDWWFTNEGIILDTAGRYTISVDAAEDREEWTAFLELLKKFRKKSPINGLLVMVSVDELMQQSEDGIEAHARNIRSRVDELINKLEIIFPVYLIFTKCDLVSGFVEFFGDFKKREREQVWGYTCKYDPERTILAHEEFSRETESLFAALKTRRVCKLHADMRPGDEKKVYLFPLEFNAARKKLTGFVETLFQPNPFQQDPPLRGVYFTSGTQEGTPIGQVIDGMAREMDIPPEIAEVVQAAPEKKSYFIKDLFSQIIMSDIAGVRQTTGSLKRGRWVRAVLAGVVLLAMVLALFALGTSFLANRNLLSETADAAEVIKTVGNDPKDIDDLRKLDRTRRQLFKLDDYEDNGAPWHLRWGLYKGNKINHRARRNMMIKLTPMLMQPTVQKMENFLINSPVDDQFYAMGMLYLELTKPLDSADLDARELTEHLNFVWGINREDEEWRDDFRDPASRLAEYWWKHREVLGKTVLSRNQADYDHINDKIQRDYNLNRVYAELILKANRELESIELVDIVSSPVLAGDVSVEGAYTKIGWETEVEERIKRTREDIEANEFKRKALEDELPRLEETLRRMYYRYYLDAWQDFLGGIEVVHFADISRAQDGLSEINDAVSSPIILVLKKAAENSVVLREGQEPIDEIWREFKGINRFLDRDDPEKEIPEEASTRMESFLGYLTDADATLGDGDSDLGSNKDCGKIWNRVASDLRKFKRKAEKLIGSGGSARDEASKLLGAPFEQAQTAVYTNACACLNTAWEDRVYGPFQDELDGNYPFNEHGTDADPALVVDFFKRDGILFTFHRDEVEPSGLTLPRQYTQAINDGKRIRKIISGNGFRVSFKLIAESPFYRGSDLESVSFKMGNDRLEYKMGGTREKGFVWKGNDIDCELSIYPMTGNSLHASGYWSLFRLIDRGEINRDSRTVAWTFRKRHDVKYKIGGPNADFILGGGFKFSCPSRICGGR
jgi:type VI secretion system protein ImpL